MEEITATNKRKRDDKTTEDYDVLEYDNESPSSPGLPPLPPPVMDLITSAVASNNSNNHNPPASSSELSKPKYTGVSYNQGSTKYQARIRYNGKQSFLGNFILQSDAAHAYDQGVLRFALSGQRSPNFSDFAEYQRAREEETAERNLNTVDNNAALSLQAIMNQIQSRISELLSPSKTKLSSYKGIKKSSVRYETQIRHCKRGYSLGSYVLETDAAHAYDCAAKLLKSKTECNFADEGVYLVKRGEEMERRGLVSGGGAGGVEPLEAIEEMIEKRLKIIRDRIGEEV